MVGAVNRVSAAPVILRAVRDPVPAARRAAPQDQDPADAASELLRRARRAEMAALLASMAAAPPGAHRMAAHILDEAERKLVRLKAEARAAAASGDRKAARAIARELAVIARQIADAAQDYAVAEALPDRVSPALAKAAARMDTGAPADAGDAAEAGALVGQATAAAAEAAQAASATEEPEPTQVEGGNQQVRQSLEPGLAPDSASPSGSGSAHDEGILVRAHRLFEEAVDLLRAMADLIGRRPGRADPADPTVLPVWPFAIFVAVTSAPLPVAAHGR